MLKVTFEKPINNFVWSASHYFSIYGNNNNKWFSDPIVQQMIMDIDKTKVILYNNAVLFASSILGGIQATDLSGGVKGLILMYKLEKLSSYFFKSSSFGHNCFPWIFQIAKNQDIYMYVNSFFRLPKYEQDYERSLVNEYGDYDYTVMNLDNNNEIVTGFKGLLELFVAGKAGVYR